MAKTSKDKKEEPLKFEGDFNDFLRLALNHEPIKIKKRDKVTTKDNPKEVYWVTAIHIDTGRVEVKKEDSEETLEFNEDDLVVVV
ncbi:hypothetical protein DBR32_03300 [Taibaiella sp. KBW10]|uniref:hypothetical protein n=1 Tax=Taibaiella sp. KBW10 TaxID=2153357 RepID=UPI000F597580|nr:hypothetical protein [Taibaiella sp. KBW10]RQO32632.1 hypothetical protein DBR32_03300 [Taibaiella sp. KBW10]